MVATTTLVVGESSAALRVARPASNMERVSEPHALGRQAVEVRRLIGRENPGVLLDDTDIMICPSAPQSSGSGRPLGRSPVPTGPRSAYSSFGQEAIIPGPSEERVASSGLKSCNCTDNLCALMV